MLCDWSHWARTGGITGTGGLQPAAKQDRVESSSTCRSVWTLIAWVTLCCDFALLALSGVFFVKPSMVADDCYLL